MSLNPELAQLLPVLETQGVVRYAGSAMQRARAAHDRSVTRLTPLPWRAAVAHTYDRALPGPAGPVPVRVYRPRQHEPLAVVVWFHGGGWCTGSLDTGDVLAREIAAGLPAVVVSVGYRLAPEHPWPAARDDAWAALAWALHQAGGLGGDPRGVVVGGDSAGGNIAAALVQQAHSAGIDLAAQLLFYPAVDLDLTDADRYPSMREFAEGYGLPAENLRMAVQQYVAAGIHPADPAVSPLRAPHLTGLPPTVLFVAGCDPLRDQGRAYAEALRRASVPVVLHDGAGLIHGSFDLIGSAPSVRAHLDRVLTSLRELVPPRAA